VSIVNRHGVRVSFNVNHRHVITVDDRAADRAKSLEMAARIKLGWPVEKVARYYNVHRTTVWRRVRAAPSEAVTRATQLVGGLRLPVADTNAP
jgi:DNA invertase Pin-like site-specific DNA recombinase